MGNANAMTQDHMRELKKQGRAMDARLTGANERVEGVKEELRTAVTLRRVAHIPALQKRLAQATKTRDRVTKRLADNQKQQDTLDNAQSLGNEARLTQKTSRLVERHVRMANPVAAASAASDLQRAQMQMDLTAEMMDDAMADDDDEEVAGNEEAAEFVRTLCDEASLKLADDLSAPPSKSAAAAAPRGEETPHWTRELDEWTPPT